MFRVELLVDERNELGEGPLWDVKEQRLYWIDSYRKTVQRCDARGGDLRRWSVPEHIGSMCLREKEGAVVCLRNGLHFLDFSSGDVTPIADPEKDVRRTRFNDGKVDRQGRFLVGSMDYEEREPLAGLYRLDPDLSLTQLESGIVVSNGPCWSLDGRTFYFADTWARRIWAYDYDTSTGALPSRRVFADFESHLRGYPDGATVDTEDCVLSAEVYGGRLVRFAPDGTIDRLVGMPVDSITSVMFGGADLDVLFITSMARPFRGRRRREHEAGGAFAVYGLGVRGVPEPRFQRLAGSEEERQMRIEVLVDVKPTLGEGPLWDADEERLYWLDSFDGRVFRCTADGSEIRAWDLPQKIGSMCLRKGGGAVVSLARGWHFLDFRSGAVKLIHDPEPDRPNNRLNDGKVDKRGRFLSGSMDTMEEGPNGALYRLDPDLKVAQLEGGIIVSNGPCWSPDGRIFYFSDTWSGQISAYDYDLETGTIINKRTFAKMTFEGGAFDGATVDAEGCVWSAIVYSGKLARYSPDGRIERVIDMPVKKVTSVMFGGPDLDVLYVTSMAKPPLPRFPADPALRGALFAIYDLGIRGVPEPRFAG